MRAIRQRTRPRSIPPDTQLRELRYYLGLLAAGYRHALQPDPLARSQRGERIALGIELPELDVVPLWSSCRRDGSVSIPFVEFILRQVGRLMDSLSSSAAGGPGSPALRAARRAIHHVLAQLEVEPGRDLPLPRLGDVYLPQAVLDPLCRQDGLLSRAARACEAMAAGTPAAVS